MLFVLILAAALWGLGALMGAPVRARLTMVGVLLAGVLVIQLTLPEGAALRVATGGSPAPWLLLGALGGVVWGYGGVLGALRSRGAARAAEAGIGQDGAPSPSGRPEAFRPAELERYARHIMLRELGGPGQQRLKAARVLVIGAGGLGSPVLLYLAAAGVGTIGVIDDDEVDNSNLQRQVIHADARIGMPKVRSAQIAMEALNPFIAVQPYKRRLDAALAADLFPAHDLILDGTDNFDTRYLVNAAAVAAGKPLVAAAIAQWEGQISVYDPARGAPCYACVFPNRPAAGLAPTCAEAGVAAPLPGVLGTMMAVEALKVLTGAGTPLRGRMLIYDALEGESRQITVRRAPACPVCGGVHPAPAT